MIRGIIFDCFGVLYRNQREAFFDAFPDQRSELHDLNAQADRGFIDRPAYVREVERITGLDAQAVAKGFASEHAFNAELAAYTTVHLKPRFKVGLLSNIGEGWLNDFFTANQLHDLFDAIVLSSREGMTKPDRRIFERTSERLGLRPEECIMIDDSAENCRGAEAAGMKSIQFSGNASLLRQLRQMTKEKE